jgi:SulP family sulfate permease
VWALRGSKHLQGYRRAWLPPDIIAGLTVWAELVSHSLAWPSVAGIPAVVGLYAAVPALVLYALLGSSRHLIVAGMFESLSEATEAAVVNAAVIELVAIGGR